MPVGYMSDDLQAEAVLDMLEEYGMCHPGLHPNTGELFIQSSLTWERDDHEFSFGPPAPPSRIIETYCDECESVTDTRELSPREWAAAQRAYKKDLAHYRKTQGKGRVAGKTTITGDFSCRSGSSVQGGWTGKEWLWSQIETSHR